MKNRAVIAGCLAVLVGVAAIGARGLPSQTTGQAGGQTTGQRQGAAPQTPPVQLTLVADVQRMYNNLKNNLTKSADLFPADKYDWRPTPEVRTWGGLFAHIVDDNYGFCSPITGEDKPPVLDNEGQPTDAAKNLTKDDIVLMLADSFSRCDKAFVLVRPENMLDRFTPTSSRSRIGALIYSVQHISEHYGNAVTYMRLNHIVPPSSAPAPGRGRY
jgi:uncharacterized damage-inducible protein DinB